MRLLSAPAYNFKQQGNGRLASDKLKTGAEHQTEVDEMHGTLSKMLNARKKMDT